MSMNLFRQAQQLQARLAKAQEELGSEKVEGSAGGGAVTVVMNGHQRVEAVKIVPEVVDPSDVEMLQDLVMSAINDAIEKTQELAKTRLGALTGGLKIPGLF